MEKTDFLVESLSIQEFTGWCSDVEVGENFSSSLSFYLKWYKGNLENKIRFEDELARELEKYIEYVEAQI